MNDKEGVVGYKIDHFLDLKNDFDIIHHPLSNSVKMKSFPIVTLLCFVVVTFVTMMNAKHSAHLAKRTGSSSFQSIAEGFAKIAETIKALDDAQQAAGQSGTPDFSKASKGLAELSMEAEATEHELRAIGVVKLDASTSKSIATSLTLSAQYVKGITQMIKIGKDFFAKGNATMTVIQILKANISQFKSLFTELDRHVDFAILRSYAPQQIIFICSIVDAVVTLDPKQISSGAKEFCSSKKSDYFDPNVFGGCTNTPKGYGSCGNSPTTFYQQAYTAGTMGSNSTSCTSAPKPPKSFAIPANCLSHGK